MNGSTETIWGCPSGRWGRWSCVKPPCGYLHGCPGRVLGLRPVAQRSPGGAWRKVAKYPLWAGLRAVEQKGLGVSAE